jgi:hypothetical protein
MADEVATKTKNTAEILGESSAKEMLQDIFSDIHPALTDEKRLLADVFTPQTAADFIVRLTNLDKVLSVDDSFEITLKKIQDQIDAAEAMRDSLLEQVFRQIRPIERSYRMLMLFFENSKVPDGKVRKAVEVHVFNADPRAMKNAAESFSVAAIETFCEKRNDNFNFRDDICNLVIPGYLSQAVREKFEDIANARSMLLITDTDDEKSFKNLDKNFGPGGKYEFLVRPEDRAASDVVTTGYLQLRPKYWFEEKVDSGDDLYGPPSLVFAGAVARTDDAKGIAHGPVGTVFGQIVGSDKCRFEPLIGEMERLTMQLQLITVVRDADNHLCFFGCRNLADDPDGVMKFFTAYRILRLLGRRCRHYLLQVAGQPLTRDFIDERVEAPIKKILDEYKHDGTLLEGDVKVDKDYDKMMQGICEINLIVRPTGLGETFRVKIDVPPFKPQVEGKGVAG